MVPRETYGTPKDFCRLVDVAHAHDIAVILDLVLAHSGHEHPFNRMYPYKQSPWYGPGVGEPNQFGLPTFDYSKDPAYAFAKDVQACWLKNYHIDGFRYDYLIGIGSDQKGKGLPGLMALARAIQPDAFFIGECIPENPEFVNNSGLGAVWHMRSCQALQALLLETDVAPYSWSRFAEAVRTFDPATQGYKEPIFVINYAESHDEKRIMAGIRERGFDEKTALKKSVLGALVLMTIPGEPMLYQGQEWGEASAKVLTPNKIHWTIAQDGGGKQLEAAYQQACKLRRLRTSTRSGSFVMPVIDEQKKCIAYHRQLGESDQVAMAVNFSGQIQTLSIPLPQAGKWQEYPDGEFFDASGCIDRQLDPYSAIIFLSGKS
jgi:1,4-alpha-glucan branching enzyme